MNKLTFLIIAIIGLIPGLFLLWTMIRSYDSQVPDNVIGGNKFVTEIFLKGSGINISITPSWTAIIALSIASIAYITVLALITNKIN